MRTRSNDDTQDIFSSRRDEAHRSWRLWVTLGILAIVAATGCTASVRVRPSVAGYTVTPVSDYDVPVAIDRYPHVLYRDRYAYLVDGQWYYPTSDGWVVFLEEPRPLADYRMRVQTAPPATRAPDVYYGYPPPPPAPEPPRELHREYRPE